MSDGKMDSPRKSSHSHANGTCAALGTWRKSSLSFANGNCVEVGQGDGIGVRDTAQEGLPDRTEIEFPPAAWRAFTRRLKSA